ncbi:MAG: STAS domain-containing protein [Flavobacteriales bacterium]|nr:STAS domain-containing protein [Flavobacteriales bacterium]
MSFHFHIEERQACCVISIEGKFVDRGNEKNILEEFDGSLAEGQRDFILDMKGMQLLNSEGINVLVRIVNIANGKKARIVFVHVPDHIEELLHVIKLNSVFIIKADLQDGLEYLKEQ